MIRKLILISIMLVCLFMTGCSMYTKNEYSYQFIIDVPAQKQQDDTSEEVNPTENVEPDDIFQIPDDFAIDEEPSDEEELYISDPFTEWDELEEQVPYESLDDKYITEFSELAPSTRMSFEELVGDNGLYNYPEGFPVPDTYKIIVDLYYQVVMVYKKDQNGDYTIPVRYMLCSSGAPSSQSPTGTFEMKSYRVRYSLFNNTDVYGQYWSLITGRIYFHSILYSKKDASTYTESSYNNLGKNVSHGCIRLTVPDARWIWYNAAPGTTVVIRSGSSKDSETAVIRDQLKLAKLPNERPDSITGDNVPYTDNWTIENVPHDVEFIQGSQ